MRNFLFKILLLIRLPIFVLKRNKLSFLSNIGPNVLLSNCIIGKYNYVGRNSILNNVNLGNYCSIAPNVQIGGMEHSYWWYSTSTFLSTECVDDKQTIIGHDVWIASGAIIKQGVKIGNGAVIGACSFVNKDVPPYSIVVGCPSKILKYRFNNDTINHLESVKYWELPPEKAKKILNTIDNKCIR